MKVCHLYMIDSMDEVTHGHQQLLSKRRKQIQVKYVFQPVPTFVMSYFVSTKHY